MVNYYGVQSVNNYYTNHTPMTVLIINGALQGMVPCKGLDKEHSPYVV